MANPIALVRENSATKIHDFNMPAVISDHNKRNRKYDVIILGATGFAGRHVVESMLKLTKNLRWAVAGRNTYELTKLLEDLNTKTGVNPSNVGRLYCDVNDVDSLLPITEMTRLIVNCIGPYIVYGEPVVLSCLISRTDYIDICGEPLFMEKIEILYDRIAEKYGILIVNSCGFDSLPCDVGLQLVKNKFSGTLNSVEVIHEFPTEDLTFSNTALKCMVYSFANSKLLKALRSSVNGPNFKKYMPKNDFFLPSRGRMFFNDEVKSWCIPFMGANNSVMVRSSAFDLNILNQRPIHSRAYLAVPNIFKCLLLMLWTLMLMFLSKFEKLRDCVMKYPEGFSFGYCSKNGPTEQQMAVSSFKTHIYGKGWKNILLKPDECPLDEPTDHIYCIVEGQEPAYVATSKIVVGCILTMLNDRDQMILPGGVFTPGVAFSRTKLVERLKNFDITFSLRRP